MHFESVILQPKTKQKKHRKMKNTNPIFSLKNFRSFGEEGADFELAPITVLTGCNSAGKSSLVKALMLLSNETFIVTGCSMGGFHAGNFFFRRPDLFDSLLALSGLYYAGYFFPNYQDSLVYDNSPYDFLQHMPADHPYWDIYRQRRIILCVGQGAWEDELLESTRKMDGLLREHHIPAWVDYWGFDSAHDWAWWRKQVYYFIDKLENTDNVEYII